MALTATDAPASDALEVIPDQARYPDGAVARVLLRSPVAPATALVTLERDGVAHAQVVDLRGRLIATLVDEALPPGSHEATWNGRNDRWMEMPSGVYISRLKAGGHVVHERMMLVR